MSGIETFAWGVLGAFLGYIFIFLLPQLRPIYNGSLIFNFRRIMVALLAVLILIACGGLLAVAMGDASHPKHAIFYGAGWEGFFKGGLETLKNYISRND